MFLYSTRNEAVQTVSKTTGTAAAQTAVTFVEKLTHNNTQEVGSSLVFDVKCEVCDVGNEKDAWDFAEPVDNTCVFNVAEFMKHFQQPKNTT
jgi:hypothetical protein